MDQAYWKWREIVDNAEEGIKFYSDVIDGLLARGITPFVVSTLELKFRVRSDFLTIRTVPDTLPLGPPTSSARPVQGLAQQGGDRPRLRPLRSGAHPKFPVSDAPC